MSFSRIMEISTVVGCRMDCSFCPQPTHVHTYAGRESVKFKMTLDDFKQCIDKIPVDVEIQFAGMAEPWLNKQCTDMLLYARERGHSVAVFTTCVGMTPDDVERFKNVNPRLFCIHLPDDSGQMKLNPDEEYIDTVNACIEKISTCNLMCVGNLHPLVRARIDRSVQDGTAGLISRAGNLKNRAIKRKCGTLKHLPCMDHSVLMPNGDVLLCCMDYAQQHILGNLLKDIYTDLFNGNGREFQRVLDGLKDESLDTLCRTCEIAEVES